MRWETTFCVGRYQCSMSYSQRDGMHCEWSPGVPQKLSKQELDEYRAGRDALLSEVAKHLGGKALVIET